MRAIKMMILAGMFLFAGATSAVTVSVVPGGDVGLSDEPIYGGYFAGIVTLDIDGVKYPAMVTDWDLTLSQDPSAISGSWVAPLYTQSDIDGGASVYWQPEGYRMAAQIFLYALLGYDPADPLWTAGHNEMIWNTLSGSPWEYGDREYYYDAETDTSVTIHDFYTYDYLVAGLDPNFDYSSFMEVLSYGGGRVEEFLVYTQMSSVPAPAAIWLFGSGLLGFIAVARRKINQGTQYLFI